MKKFYKPITPNDEQAGSLISGMNTSTTKKARVDVEFNRNDIIIDPGLRKPIQQYKIEIRDQVRREYLLQGPKLPVGHNFPSKQYGKQRRSFQETWFKKFDWLEYIVDKDAAYCFYCYLFNQSRGDTFMNDAFTKAGFSNWKKAIEVFNEHVGAAGSAHCRARLHCEDFKNQRQSMSHLLTTHSREMEIAYRARLTIILHVVRFLLLQGLAFRGHDESSSSRNRGNFLALVEYTKDNNCEVACVLNENAPRNNQMTSVIIQKDLVKACAEQTILNIIEDLGDSYFSLLVDESRDASIKEQMVVIVRFVNKKGQIIERFFGVEHVMDTSASSLKTTLDNLFACHGLSMSILRGQGYDGASNMRGEFNGLQKLILNENPYAFYIHCFAHQLQLVVVAVAKNTLSISDFFSYTTLIVTMASSSCKRKDVLLQKHHDSIMDKLDKKEIFLGRGKNQETSLARPGDTRWGSHHTTLVRIFTMWGSVIEVLENISHDGIDSSSRGKASGLIQKMETFEFVFILFLMMKVLALTNELSHALQRNDQNIVNAMVLIASIKELLQELRDCGWGSLLEDVNKFCVMKSISIPNMEDKIPSRGSSRRGGQWVTYQHHYHAEIFNVVIDSILVEINTRFSETSSELLRCISCLNPRDSFSRFNSEKLVRIAEIYSDDFSIYERVILKDQLGIYIHVVRRRPKFLCCNDLASLAMKMVQTEEHLVFPLVYRLIELALILPVATATVERAFSVMNIVKTELHNKISDDWLNDLMVCYIERYMFRGVSDENILQHFQNMKTRRIQLSRLS